MIFITDAAHVPGGVRGHLRSKHLAFELAKKTLAFFFKSDGVGTNFVGQHTGARWRRGR
jgi:hypothetical protein